MPDITVTRTIAAPAADVWKLVSDPTRTGEWSPENTGAKWRGDASGPALGAQFRGSNKNGKFRWQTTCTITECVENEAFSFDVKTGPIPIAAWGYQLEETDGGTLVSEHWTMMEPDIFNKIVCKVLGVDDRAEFNRQGMEATLAAMAAELEDS